MILVVNKVDRPDARIAEVVDEVYELFLDLDADESQIDFPIVYTQRPGRPGVARRRRDRGHRPRAAARPAARARSRRPSTTPSHPLQAHVTNLDASPYVGRLALCRVRNGTIRKGQPIAWCRADGDDRERAQVAELYVTEALDRVDADEAGPGEIIAVAGIPEVTIGETLADPDDPRPLPVITVDEPSLSVTIGINTSPLAGQDGNKLTARQIKDRLDAELVGNVSLRVQRHRAPRRLGGPGPRRAAARDPRRADAPRGLRADRRQAAGASPARSTARSTSRSSGMTIDVPEDYVGVVTQLLALRKGRMEQMVNHGTGWVRMDYLVPARGLIGFRTEFLTETRGTGLLHHVFDALGAVGRRAAHAPDRLARRRPPRHGRDASRCSTCRSAGRCSSARARRSTRA